MTNQSPTIRLMLAGVSLALVPAAISAQTCLGGASFADRHVHVAADASFGTRARSAGAGVGIGSQSGPFASGTFGRAHADDLDDDASVFSGTAGIGLGLLPQPTTLVCPFISAGTVNGSTLRTGERTTSQAFGVGASMGTILNATPGLAFVPFFGAATVTQTNTIRTDLLNFAKTERHTEVYLGMGLVFGKVMTVRPSATFFKAFGRTERVLGLRLSYGFGVVHRAPALQGPGSLKTVWLDPRAKVYYCQGSRTYGGTMQGSFVTEREALAAGATPEHGKRC